MMAPYTVAHLKLALQLQEQGFEFADGERLHVYLTNTLDQLHQKTAAMLGQWIARENEGAEKIKRAMPVEVVLDNPPYSGESRNKSDWIMDLLKPYKTEPEGGPLKVRNSKWINATQYFDGVPPETWAFKVGGYQVCEKWLKDRKDRKGRSLAIEGIKHCSSVVAALTRTRELMLDIDAVANGRLWPA